MSVEEYQKALKELFTNKLNFDVTCEWNSQMHSNSYAPRLDVAVGPFSLIDGTSLNQDYDQLYDYQEPFIYQLVKVHLLNTGVISQELDPEVIEASILNKIERMKYFNFNSRCFIAIEIENKVSRKHLMGGAINASVLGRIAIAVGFTEEKHRAFLNLNRYFDYLQSVHKPTFETHNLLIISAEQLLNVLHEF